MRTIAELSVRPEWIDYNGHLSEAYYVLVFGYATDAAMEHLGLDDEYRQRTGCSLYTVEAHVRYLREVTSAGRLDVTTRIVGTGRKKMRLCHEMSADGELVATEELLALHVASEGALPFPDDVRAQADALVEPLPDYAGRSVSG